MTAAERETGEAILRAAAELFGERGYKATTTRAIAERAGVNEVTLFRRFGSKRGILAGLGELWGKRMAGLVVGAVPDPQDTRGTLEALARLEVEQAESSGGVAMRLAMDAASCEEVAEWMGQGLPANLAGLITYLSERQIAGDLRTDIDPRVMAEAFFALTSQVVMSRQVLGGVNDYELPMSVVSGQLFDVFMRGVGMREGT